MRIYDANANILEFKPKSRRVEPIYQSHCSKRKDYFEFSEEALIKLEEMLKNKIIKKGE